MPTERLLPELQNPEVYKRTGRRQMEGVCQSAGPDTKKLPKSPIVLSLLPTALSSPEMSPSLDSILHL